MIISVHKRICGVLFKACNLRLHPLIKGSIALNCATEHTGNEHIAELFPHESKSGCEREWLEMLTSDLTPLYIISSTLYKGPFSPGKLTNILPLEVVTCLSPSGSIHHWPFWACTLSLRTRLATDLLSECEVKDTNMATLVYRPSGQMWADQWTAAVFRGILQNLSHKGVIDVQASGLLQCAPEIISVKVLLHWIRLALTWARQLSSCSLCSRIKIEEEYAKNLSKLSLSPLAAQEEGWVP